MGPAPCRTGPGGTGPEATPAPGLVRAEAGGSTALALFGLAFCLVLAGLAIDVGQARHATAQLAVAADAAAHAGAVALAATGGEADPWEDAGDEAVLTAVTALMARNAPGLPGGATRALHYDPATNRLEEPQLAGASANAVLVRLGRSRAAGTALPTVALRLFGTPALDLAGLSVAALVPTRLCAAGDGLYARGHLEAAGRIVAGSGLCLHAQRTIRLGALPELAAGTRLSLPRRADCRGHCAELGAPVTETNLIQPPHGARIAALAEAFATPRLRRPEREAFFADRPRAADLSPLEELGVVTADLRTGDVVPLRPIQLMRARELPAGLVYRVSCAREPADRFLLLGDPGPVMRGAALVTDCPVVVASAADIAGGLVISTWGGLPGSALPGIEIVNGDDAAGCTGGRAMLMALRSVFLLPGTSGSGLALVSAGDIEAFAPPEGAAPTRHRGLAAHAGGDIRIEGAHRFEACGTPDPAALLPPLQVIRQVTPVNAEALGRAAMPAAPPPATRRTLAAARP